ncbi:MAG: YdcH family protein [Hoeflea sp.]|jgi:hypothetical protein|uniref:YdcH family protein n=1 Tax=Hoeflea sp. TaxID=1940281 RepID=UPI0032EE691E
MIATLKALRSRHSIIESRIQREQMRPSPDSLRVMSMKKIRLQLREQIQKAEAMVLKSSERTPA